MITINVSLILIFLFLLTFTAWCFCCFPASATPRNEASLVVIGILVAIAVFVLL